MGSGSDVASIKTSARKAGDDYVIDGGKMWTTSGTQADFCCVLASLQLEVLGMLADQLQNTAGSQDDLVFDGRIDCG